MDRRLQFLLGAIAVVAAIWLYQQFGTATLRVTSEPEGAVIRIDGRQRGLTPMERLEVDAGSHRLEVVHSHYAPYVEGIRVSRGDHESRHVVLEPGEGVFSLLSNPRNAWVEVDGRRVGRTPTQHTVVSGPHVIRMGLEERHIVEETHTVRHGQILEVNFNLNIDPHGSLTITTRPRNARIEFVGEDLAYEPGMRLRIGEYAIRVSRSGYKAQEFRYRVRYGNNLHDVSLEREYGRLVVQTAQQDTDVTVAIDDGGGVKRSTYRDAMTIPTGSVEVRARATGYRTQVKTIRMGPNGATVRFDLQPMQVTIGAEFQDRLASGGEGPVMVVVPPGEFTMGDANGSFSEKPARRVRLTQPFAVSKFEITIGEYLEFADATNRAVSAQVEVDKPSHAMAYVTFEDASRYAAWLSTQTGHHYRVPSEAEWEYFTRGGTQTDYFFGNDPLKLCEYANMADLATRKVYREWDVIRCDDGAVRPGPVGRYKPNPFGLHDVYGNVSEWVMDCGMPNYARAPTDGSPAEEAVGCGTRGIRGGSWDSTAGEARSANRNTATGANDDRGIRLVRDL